MADTRNQNPKTSEQPAKGRTATPSNVPQTAGPDGPSPDHISRRAYELFQKRGGKHGYHMDDWHEAERQLREERGGATASATKTTAKKSAAKKSAAKKATAKKSVAKKSAAKKSAAKKTGGQG